MDLFKQFSLKERGYLEKLTRPATESELIGERNNRILLGLLLIVLSALVFTGVFAIVKHLSLLF